MKKLILLVLLIIIVVSGRQLVEIFSNYQITTTYYETIQETYRTVVEPNITISPTKEEPNVTPSPTKKATSKRSKTQKSDKVRAHTTKLKPPITVDFPALKAVNSDVIGWLYSEGTPIDYPVLHSSNNNKYIHKLLNGEYSVNGSIFLDSRCKSNFKNDNSILYGHHMRNGSMFASLNNYKTQDYYNEHSQLWLLTPKRSYLLLPFSAMVVSTNSLYYKTDIQDKQVFIDKAINNSFFIPNTIPNVADRFITLSTCDYTFDNARLIVVCILISTSNP